MKSRFAFRLRAKPAPWLLLFVISACGAWADDVTYRWDFTNRTHYYLSEEVNKIEVSEPAPGYCQLVLQAQKMSQMTVSNYLQGLYSSVVFGPDVSLLLTSSGDNYAASGHFTSRIRDAGAGGVWTHIASAVSDADHHIDPSIVGLYHMESPEWLDSVSGRVGTHTNAVFSPAAKHGKWSGSFDRTGYVDFVPSSTITTSYSLMFWINARQTEAQADNYALSFGYPGQIVLSIRVGGHANYPPGWPARSIGVMVYRGEAQAASTTPGSFTDANDGSVWRHICITYDSTATPTIHVYKDAVDLPLNVNNISGSVGAYSTLSLGMRMDRHWGMLGLLDEVAIYNRALSPQELALLYTNYARSHPCKFQLRSSSATNNLALKAFVGPDDTANTFYSANDALRDGIEFDQQARYAQYRCYFSSSVDMKKSPRLDAVGLYSTKGAQIDNVLGDFSQGLRDATAPDDQANVTWRPLGDHEPFVGLLKRAEGANETNGVFVSRVITNPAGPLAWNQIAWTCGGEGVDADTPANQISGLIGLYQDNWSDVSLHGHGGTVSPGYSAYSDIAKLGSKSLPFNGTADYVDTFGFATIRSLEFWVRNENDSDALMALTGASSLSISNRMVTVLGFGAQSPAIYVNGNPNSTRLVPGWNHVALVWSAMVNASGLTVGRVGADYMEGLLDEMAVWDRALGGGEIRERFVRGRRDIAGYVEMQVRASNDPNFSGVPFSGSYRASPAAIVASGQYIQYRAWLVGDGVGTPALTSVTLTDEAFTTFQDGVAEFGKGQFEAGKSALYGDEINVPQPVVINPANVSISSCTNLLGLWHMDNSWKDDVGGGVGTPSGGAQFNPVGKVGTHAGLFNTGTGKVALVSSPLGSAPFTVSCWMWSAMTSRGAILSSYSGPGAPCIKVEVNSDGAGGTVTGKVAVVISNGTDTRSVVSSRGSLNDGRWHNLMAMRNANQLLLYLDGDLVGGAEIGPAFGDIGGGSPVLGYSSDSGYFVGLLDELVIFRHALPRAEFGEICGAGCSTVNPGSFTSATLDARQPATWDKIAWGAHGIFGNAVTNTARGLVALWHLDEAGGLAVDATGNGNNGTVAGTQNVTGKFGKCVRLNGAGDKVAIPDSALLEPAALTVEAWICPNSAVSATIFDKRNANNGYALFTDSTGYPCFWLGGGGAGATVRGFNVLRSGQWNHVAGTFDGLNARLYVNGQTAGAASPVGVNLAAGAAAIGANYLNGNFLDGLVDEVAVFGRALAPAELADHYAAGVVTLKFQCRTWSPGPMGGFVGPGGSPNTYFTISSGDDLIGNVPLGQHFQYKAYLATEDHRIPPTLLGVSVDVSSYPSDNPTAEPVEAQARLFPGRLRGFNHALWTAPDDIGGTARVEYQITGDTGAGPNWYYWDTFGTPNQWRVAPPGAQYPFYTSTRDEINANIGAFYNLPDYLEKGGAFRFRTHLHSNGDYQIKVDLVDLVHSDGRIVITQPNTNEVGQNAFIVGVTNLIKWVSAGNVSDNLRLSYSYDSGTNWTLIASGVPNTGVYPWLTPWNPADREHFHCRIRIEDAGDTTGAIWDESNADFEIVHRFRVINPNGGEAWYTGETNLITWATPPLRGGTAWLMFNGKDQTNWTDFVAGTRITTTTNNSEGITNNMFVWTIPKNDASIISEQARIGVSLEAFARGFDCSDATFLMGGIRIVQPAAGTPWNRGNTEQITWVSAGAGPDVILEYSGDGGTNWVTLTNSAPNVTGTNTCNWTISESVVTDPSVRAMLRASGKGAYARAWGMSDIFTIADVDIKRPAPGEKWQIGATNTIEWTAGGAGVEVDVSYTADNGATWHLIQSRCVNLDYPRTNTLVWVAPSDPSVAARIKIQGVDNYTSLWAQSEFFRIAGVRIDSPNGGGMDSDWLLGRQESILWSAAEAGAAGVGNLYLSYTGDTNYALIKSSQNLETRILPYTPTLPTVKGRAKIVATSPDVTNMWDISDHDFTVVGVKMMAPVTGAVYTVGTNIDDAIQWLSAGTKKTSADVYYLLPGKPGVNIVPGTANADDAPIHDNRRVWASGFIGLIEPSEQARLAVVTAGGSYTGYSEVFTARGLKLTRPGPDAIFAIGQPENLYWIEAGIDPGAKANLYLSLNGGSTWLPSPLLSAATWVGASTVQVWNVDSGLDPTTNALMRMQIYESPTPADINYQVYSKPFNLKGLKVLKPALGDNWELGSTQAIAFLSAKASALATIYYSANGGLSYDAAPVAEDIAIHHGPNTNLWAIEYTRTPSTNARIKVVSGALTAVSTNFTLGGIMVLRPASYDIWAVGETNTIRWIAIGTSGSQTIEVMTNGVVAQTLTGVTGTSYEWEVPLTAVGSNVTIRVRDEGPLAYEGVSQPFQVVSEPMIRIISPQPGEFWRASETYRVEWTKGGGMPFDFEVRYSADGFTNSILLTQAQQYEAVENRFWLEWTIGKDDGLGPFQISVSNRVMTAPVVRDVSGVFCLSPKFTMVSPNGGESYYALKDTWVQWYTEGDVSAVDMYYSTNASRATDGWVKINSAPIPCRGDKTTSQYEWKVPDLISDIVWLRVQDTNYTALYDKNFRGPFDDSDNCFTARYYAITWRVYYVDENGATNQLDHLSVADSSGWSASDMASGVTAYYPYGYFDTLWYREFFHDKVVFDWVSEPSRTQEVEMTKSQVEPDYHVLASFTFNETLTNFTIRAWLERGGSILPLPDQCAIHVFNSAGGRIGTLTSYDPIEGIFWLTWAVPVGQYDSEEVFFAKVMIRYSGTIYSSGLTFMMRQTVGKGDVPQNYTIKATFTYTMAATNFSIQSWLEYSGSMMEGVSNSTIWIYDRAGQEVTSLFRAVPLQGVFWFDWDVSDKGYDDTDTFLGKVQIVYAGKAYSAGFTFMPRQVASGDMETVIGYLSDSTSNILDRVGGVSGEVTAMRAEVERGISNLSSQIGLSTTNLLEVLGTNSALIADALLGIGRIDTNLTILLPTASNTALTVGNIWGQVTNIAQDSLSGLSRILTRPTTIEVGSTNTFLYKSRPGYAGSVTITVSPAGFTGPMTEVVAGIYQLTGLVANWPVGSQTIACADPQARDSIIVKVVDKDVDALATMVASVSNGVRKLDGNLASLASVVSELDTAGDMTELMTAIGNVQESVDNIPPDQIVDVSGIARLEQQLGTGGNSVWNRLDVLAGKLNALGAGASDASKKAQTAKSEAANALAAIQAVKLEMARGNLRGIKPLLEQIEEYVTAIRSNVDQIPKGVQVDEYYKQMREMAETIRKLAASKGFHDWVTPTVEEPDKGAVKDTLGRLNRYMEEIKSEMRLMQKIMDETLQQPVVDEVLLVAE
ncbi:MAG: LamG domain-containing protein [Verrucomicrobiota bacterium]|nr:LamG domain-containing protein [Verrucomicrobiota bacterium]